MEEYVTHDGDPIGTGTALDYFGCLLNMALDRALAVSNGRLPPVEANFFRCEGGWRRRHHRDWRRSGGHERRGVDDLERCCEHLDC